MCDWQAALTDPLRENRHEAECGVPEAPRPIQPPFLKPLFKQRSLKVAATLLETGDQKLYVKSPSSVTPTGDLWSLLILHESAAPAPRL